MIPKIISHPRSGTHLLAYLLWKHVWPEAEEHEPYQSRIGRHHSRIGIGPATAVFTCPDGTEVVEGNRIFVPYRPLLGPHTFRPPRHKYVYVRRSFDGVARSWYRFTEFHAVEREPESFEQFLESPVDIHGTPGQAGASGWRPQQHHATHVAKHCRQRTSVVVDYEAMMEYPERVVAQVARAFERPLPRNVELPPIKLGWRSGYPRDV